MNSFLARLLAAAGLSLSVLPLQAAVSTFDAGAEGWTAQGDVEGTIEWSATGGNPGGHVVIDDRAIGGVTYFVAPGAFLGNQSGALGTSLTFDLMQVYPGSPNQFDSPDVVLQGGGLTLVYDTPVNPGNGAWTSYSVLFDVPGRAPGWRLDSGALATYGQLATVMSGLTALRIRAEYQTGADVGRLDNVVLVPEPGTWSMLAVGLSGVVVARRWQSTRQRAARDEA